MVLVYSMPSCKYCQYIYNQIKDDPDYKIIDIGKDVASMHAFLKLRDNNPVFKPYIQEGDIGIPCFVLEDGRVTLKPSDLGLHSYSETLKKTCSKDGKGC